MRITRRITLTDGSNVYRQNNTVSKPFDISRFECEEPKQLRAMSEMQYNWEKELWDNWTMFDTVVNPYQVVKSEIVKVEEDKD